LIQLYLLLNRRPDALSQYEAYCAIWRDELNRGPSARMQAIVHGLMAQTELGEGQLYVPLHLDHEKRMIEQLFAALELMPDSRASQAAFRLHTLLLPQVAYYFERRGAVLKARGSIAEADSCLHLALEFRAGLDQALPPQTPL
jgi:hypothetical protein